MNQGTESFRPPPWQDHLPWGLSLGHLADALGSFGLMPCDRPRVWAGCHPAGGSETAFQIAIFQAPIMPAIFSGSRA